MQTLEIDRFTTLCAVAVHDDGRGDGRGIAADGGPAAAARAAVRSAMIGTPE